MTGFLVVALTGQAGVDDHAESLIEAVLRLGDVVLRRHQLGWDRTLVVLLLALLGVGGGVARAKAHSSPSCRSGASGSGGRPSSTGRALASLKRLLAGGKSQAECANLLGVSVRNIGGRWPGTEIAGETRWS